MRDRRLRHGADPQALPARGAAALARFFALARSARDEAALDAAFRLTLLEQEHAAETIPPYLALGLRQRRWGHALRVCVRIPTGGGKTLLGAHALAAARPPPAGGPAAGAVAGAHQRDPPADAQRPEAPVTPTARRWRRISASMACACSTSPTATRSRPQDIGARLVIVGTLQTLRVDDTSGRDVYAYKRRPSSRISRRAPSCPASSALKRDLEVQPYLGRADLGKVKRSFAQPDVLAPPVVIIDEAHNARTPLSYDSFARLRPAALIEMTATPVRQGPPPQQRALPRLGRALKAEQMIKLPDRAGAHPNWRRRCATRCFHPQASRRGSGARERGRRLPAALSCCCRRPRTSAAMNVERLREHRSPGEHRPRAHRRRHRHAARTR